MAVYIRGMKMPRSCSVCDFLEYAGGDYQPWVACRLTEETLEDPNSRGDECPLVEVKEPHGRLIDADAIIQQAQKYEDEGNTFCLDSAEELDFYLDDEAPTIIERSEDD